MKTSRLNLFLICVSISTVALYAKTPNKWAVKKFDANKNGVLDPDEMERWKEDRRQAAAKRLAADLAKYDANGNGVMDPEEKQAKRDAKKAEVEARKQRAAADLKKYDVNQSGHLELEEVLRRDDDRAAAQKEAAKNKTAPVLELNPLLAARDAKGRIIAKPVPAPSAELQNPVPGPRWLEGYLARADLVLRTSLTQSFKFNSYFENEKYTLGQAMARTVAGDKDRGFRALSAKDANADNWNKVTAGIDYFACFVIKHQPRRYFHFGPVLPPDYIAKMKEGARLWTKVEPLGRPHPSFKRGTQGWHPEAKNSWVDIRTTDNLSMMRFTAVYLMAEESGSTDVMEAYKKRLNRFNIALYRAGNGEWDSENYLGHTITPLFNLYDFARDPFMQATGKAMLDWFYTATAVKYYRGGANGPNCRDYNHVQPFMGGSLGETGWLYFGAPVQPTKFEYDLIHGITSSYSPPPAVIALGQQNFERPRELLNTKASYHHPQAGDFHEPAAYHETYYYGRTFAYGSLAEGTRPGRSDINGFKLLCNDSIRGVADFRLAPTNDPLYTGSAKYQSEKMRFPNRLGQYRNLTLWLAKGNDVPWSASLPPTLQVEVQNGITFLRGEETWIACTPINMPALSLDGEGTQTLQNVTWTENKNVRFHNPETGKSEKKRISREITGTRYPGYQALSSQGAAKGGFSGVAIEVGEAPEFANYESFKRAVISRSKLNTGGLSRGEVGYTGAAGKSVKVAWGDTLKEFKVWRNGQLHDWEEHGRYVYRETGKDSEGLIYQKRGPEGGSLHVNAGGKTFIGKVSPKGDYTFVNR